MQSRTRRRVAVVTGARSDYGLLNPVMRAVNRHPALELQVVVTGMHLDPRFGLTVREVEDDWKPQARVVMHPEDESAPSMARSVGKGVGGLTDTFNRISSEVVLVLGDRTEAFAGAIAAVLSRRVLAHIHGGDISQGGYDEYMRHAITKLAHVHFPATARSAERVCRLGERKEYVHVVGAPGLDTILHAPLATEAEVNEHISVDLSAAFLLLIQHPVSTSPERSGEEIEATLAALRGIRVPVIAVFPNSDPGASAIVEALVQETRARSDMQLIQSLPRPVFLRILSDASTIVGNSSSSVIESTSFHIPAVNIGARQLGRECGDNVLHVPHDPEAIRVAVVRALQDEQFRKNVRNAVSPYGNGQASEKIAAHIADLEITADLFVKQLTYDSLPVESTNPGVVSPAPARKRASRKNA